MLIEIVRSGCQTGADYGGLVAAEKCGIRTAGHMPKDCKTELGPKRDWLERFGLEEHPSNLYPPRTYCNVKNSDGTIRFAVNFDSPGEKLTLKAISYYEKPFIDVDRNNPIKTNIVIDWIIENNIRDLNVAGNKESTNPTIGLFVELYLEKVFKAVRERTS